MKVKEGYLLKEVAGNVIVVPTGDAAINFDGIINLNETGAFLWKSLESEKEPKEILKAFLEEYDVDEETAKKDIELFINQMYKEGLLDL